MPAATTPSCRAGFPFPPFSFPLFLFFLLFFSDLTRSCTLGERVHPHGLGVQVYNSRRVGYAKD